MSAPRLTRQLVLESAERLGDGAGGYRRDWLALGTLWAEVLPAGAPAREGEAAATTALALRIRLRASPQGSPARPRVGQRFREGERIYAILGVTEDDAGGRYLRCHAREEVAR